MADLTLDRLRQLRSRSEEAGRYELVVDSEWADRLAKVYAELGRDPSRARKAELEAEAAELEARKGEAVVTFTFRRLPPEQYEALLAKHPPSAEQRKEEDAAKTPPMMRSTWNPETFQPAAILATVITPELDEAAVKELHTSILSHAEWAQLFNAAMKGTLRTTEVPERR
jgi:hypothetical protein